MKDWGGMRSRWGALQGQVGDASKRMFSADDEGLRSRLRAWLIRLFVRMIGNISVDEDRADVLAWLRHCREVVASDALPRKKFSEIGASIDTRKSVKGLMRSVVEGFENYKNSDLPLAVKVSVPLTLAAAPFIGGQAVGVAAIGGAVGLPALLLLFLGSAGITAILETFAKNDAGQGDILNVVVLILRDEALRRTSADFRRVMRDSVVSPSRAAMSAEESALREGLLTMNPFDFERHVMSFFEVEDIELAWVTKKSNDMGVDGFAKRKNGGLIVVQCKRYAPDNPIGRPAVQQFKGVIEEQKGVDEGYIVTTSRFSSEARESAALSGKIVLIDMTGLMLWHDKAPTF